MTRSNRTRMMTMRRTRIRRLRIWIMEVMRNHTIAAR